MKINPLQSVLVAIALLGSAFLAEVLAPRQLMARTASIDLETAIPRQFGGWKCSPTSSLLRLPILRALLTPRPKNAAGLQSGSRP